MTDGFSSLPNQSMRETFDRSVRKAQNDISSIFFDGKSDECEFGGKKYTGLRNKLACLLVANSISKVRHYFYYFIILSICCSLLYLISFIQCKKIYCYDLLIAQELFK